MRRDAYARHRREGVEGIEVVTDVVFVTASVSGGGKVIGFTTLGEAVEKTLSPSPTTVAPPKVTSKAASSERPRATTSETLKATEAIRTQSAISSTSESTEVASPTSTLATSTSAIASNSESILALTSTSASASETSIAPIASITSSAAPSSEESASGGMSTGATVGLAVAGVGVFLVICFTLAFVYRKRSQKKTQEAYGKPEDEKTGGAAAVGATIYMNGNNNLSRADTVTSEKAPRVPSLRPVTQFLPNLTVTPPAADPVSQRQSQAQVQSRPQQRAPVIASSPVGLTRSESRKAPPPALVLVKSEGEVSSAPVSSATTTNSTAPLLAKTQTSPTASSSSSLVEYTDSGDSAAGTPVAGGPAGVANTSPVHRVQMDFKPSMEDELGLRVGQLVRLLYEYDDGWALCIRLDRSQQGVCPRTCLSQRPVKPRHPGSPRPGYPNGRAQSPIGSQGSPRPYSPSGVPRAQSPGSNRSQLSQSPVQMRPQSPAQAHPKSPAGYVKQVYRPATATQQAQLRIIPASPVQRPQSPITQSPVALRAGPSQITVTTTTPAVISEAAPSTPVSPAQKPQSLPGSPPRPAVAPVRPSPLSNEQTSGHEPEHAQPVFHAM
ncbi:unnamed protein product [Tuber melanosporum]|uniref:(Perigord truffle) hypothetical protein n=1 Tax=Tuber melanosporum (strain Mel28) TaxID=656061 RepID=D5GF22_TUBMM|nr:uncharacterized protein GSTUM_00006708001 [Tuber melanosporum]CAZ83115.1 unnamed protein product [Tuber melanosporum]